MTPALKHLVAVGLLLSLKQFTIATVPVVPGVNIPEPVVETPPKICRYSLNSTLVNFTLAAGIKSRPLMQNRTVLGIMEIVLSTHKNDTATAMKLNASVADLDYLRVTPSEMFYLNCKDPAEHLATVTIGEAVNLLCSNKSEKVFSQMRRVNASVTMHGGDLFQDLAEIGKKRQWQVNGTTTVLRLMRSVVPSYNISTTMKIFGFTSEDMEYLSLTIADVAKLLNTTVALVSSHSMAFLTRFLHSYRDFYIKENATNSELRRQMRAITPNTSVHHLNELFKNYTVNQPCEFKNFLFRCKFPENVTFKEIHRVTGKTKAEIGVNFTLEELGFLVCRNAEGIKQERHCRSSRAELRERILTHYMGHQMTADMAKFEYTNATEFESAVVRNFIKRNAEKLNKTIAELAVKINVTENELANATAINVAMIMVKLTRQNIVDAIKKETPLDGILTLEEHELPQIVCGIQRRVQDRWGEPVVNVQRLWMNRTLCYHLLRTMLSFEQVQNLTLKELLVGNLGLDVETDDIPRYFNVRRCQFSNWNNSFHQIKVRDIEMMLGLKKHGIVGLPVKEILERLACALRQKVPPIIGACDETNGGCSHNCTNSSGIIHCSCENGYSLSGDGKTCEDIDQCTNRSICTVAHSMCENLPESYKCKCNAGFRATYGAAVGNAQPPLSNCDDINECNTDPCHANADCTNVAGSYLCSCKPGFVGNGKQCNDINECRPGMNNCTQLCINTNGSHTCSCRSGFRLTSDGISCDDIDECLPFIGDNTCVFVPGASCVNSRGSYSCVCTAPGLTFDPAVSSLGACVDIDECTNRSICTVAHSMCENIPESYKCKCNAGFRAKYGAAVGNAQPPLAICDDINECNTDPCHANADCTNVAGSYLCRCKPGFVGNGKQCKEKRLFDLDPDRSEEVKCDGRGRRGQKAKFTCGFPYFGDQFDDVWINCNGLISIGMRYHRHSPKDCEKKSVRKNLLIPFWADIDPSKTSSDIEVRYQQLSKGEEGSAELLRKINKLVNESTGYEDFTSCAVIITWKNLSPYSYEEDDNPYRDEKNTFQAVLVSDGLISVVIYTYPEDGMTWKKDVGTQASMGYTTKSRLCHQYKHSFTDEIFDIDTHTFADPKGNNRKGIYVFVAGQKREPSPETRCIRWVLGELLFGSSWQVQETCPCTSDAARETWSFLRLSGGPFRNRLCYAYMPYQEIPSKVCCYSTERWSFGALITTSALDSGRVCRYSPVANLETYLSNEVRYLELCCKESTKYCDLYLRVRPAEDGCSWPTGGWDYLENGGGRGRGRGRNGRRSSPRRGVCFGDPHIGTLDGFKYTFNGLGDYVLLKTEDGHRIHARTSRPSKADGGLARATVFSGFALAANGSYVAQVLYDESVPGNLSIIVSNSTWCQVLTLQDLPTDRPLIYPGVLLRRTGAKNSTVLILFNSGLSTEIDAGIESLQFANTIPPKFVNMTSGLMGNMNEDKSDDLAYPNKTVTSLQASEQEIFDLGQSWKVPEADRLFRFKNCSQQDVFFAASFRPAFLSDFNITSTMRAACGEDKQCLLDYAATGNSALAVAGKSFVQTNDEKQAKLDNMPPVIESASTLNATVGKQISLSVNTSDPNNDTVTLEAIKLPPGATFDNTTGKLTWTPSSNLDKTQAMLEFLVTDSKGAKAIKSITISLCECRNNQTCDFSRVLSTTNNSRLRTVGCDCSDQFSGDLCGTENDPCSGDPCYDGVACRNKTSEYGFTCGPCPAGLTGNGVSCSDVDECLNKTTSGCSQLCANRKGGYTCSCRPGFLASNNGKTCTDIDECDRITGSNRCTANAVCANTPGSYNCTCNPGFKGDPKVNCTDVDECTTIPKPCSQECANTVGSYTCSCRKGFKLSETRKGVCEDINECAFAISNDCERNCINLFSTYKCGCPSGFILKNDNKTCQVAPSSACDGTNGDCSHICTNSSGTVQCVCNKGYNLASNGKTCEDINECTKKISGCSQLCTNNNAAYNCSCRPGYTLLSDKTSCEDVNECNGNHGCSYMCRNLQGSYGCTCKPGYQLGANNKTCEDVNECRAVPSVCPSAKGLVCRNGRGSYECVCPPGKFAKKKKSVWDSCKAAKKYRWRVKITHYDNANLQWKDSFANSFSEEFRDLAEKLENLFDVFFEAKFGSFYRGCKIRNFIQGSVVADASLNVDPAGNVTMSSLNAALPNGTLGPLRTDPNYGGVTDFDECANTTDNDCDDKATCKNEPGTYSCACKPGYEGDGKTCSPVPVPATASPPGLSDAELAGLIVGVVLGVLLLILIIVLCVYHHRKRRNKSLQDRTFEPLPKVTRDALHKDSDSGRSSEGSLQRRYEMQGTAMYDNPDAHAQGSYDVATGTYDVIGGGDYELVDRPATYDNTAYKEDTAF